MNQLSMHFEQPVRRIETPAARNSDPITSHLAAEHITRSGVRAQQQALTYAAVKANPGCTSFEIAHASGIDRYVLARRCPEVELAGLIKRGETKHCLVTGRLALTWWPV